ncbi:hypothetical protein D9M69_694390 [compost metagenome]
MLESRRQAQALVRRQAALDGAQIVGDACFHGRHAVALLAQPRVVEPVRALVGLFFLDESGALKAQFGARGQVLGGFCHRVHHKSFPLGQHHGERVEEIGSGGGLVPENRG